MMVSINYKIASGNYFKTVLQKVAQLCFAGDMKYKYFIPGDSFVFPETIHGLSVDIPDLNSGTGCMAAGKYSDICE